MLSWWSSHLNEYKWLRIGCHISITLSVYIHLRAYKFMVKVSIEVTVDLCSWKIASMGQQLERTVRPHEPLASMEYQFKLTDRDSVTWKYLIKTGQMFYIIWPASSGSCWRRSSSCLLWIWSCTPMIWVYRTGMLQMTKVRARTKYRTTDLMYLVELKQGIIICCRLLGWRQAIDVD